MIMIFTRCTLYQKVKFTYHLVHNKLQIIDINSIFIHYILLIYQLFGYYLGTPGSSEPGSNLVLKSDQILSGIWASSEV